MKILITGSSGFIASAIIEALLLEGHQVIACARSRRNLPASPALRFQPVDLVSHTQMDAWLPLLEGVDAVINCAGILTEQHAGDFDVIHIEAPQGSGRGLKGADRFKLVPTPFADA